VFPDEVSARRFADHFHEHGLEVSVRFTEAVKELPWDVLVVKSMKPPHREITDFEATRQQIADMVGGRNDGWGCFAEKG
jgi:hypothetical protein